MRQWALIAAVALVAVLSPCSGHAQVDQCKSRDPDVALAGCTRVLQKPGLHAKDRITAYGLRGLAYAKKGMIDEAIADGLRAVEVDTRSAAGYLHRAYIFLRKPDNDRALADAERALQIDPKAHAAYHVRGVVFSRRGELDRAIADYTRAHQLNPASANYLGDRGTAYFSKGEFEKAIADFTQSMTLGPGLADPQAFRGAAYAFLGEHDRALVDLSQAIALEPKNARAYAFRARALVERDETERALADVERSLELNPNQTDAYLVRGAAYGNQGAFDRALKDYNRVISIAPKNAAAYSSRCAIYLIKDELERAIADCNLAVELNPKLSSAYASRASFYAFQRDYQKALADYEYAIQLIPKNYRALAGRGRTYVEMGQVDRGLADIERAIGLHPRFARAFGTRGLAYVKKAEHERALADFNRAIQLDARLADVYGWRAEILLEKGQATAAIADLRKVLSLPARNLREKEAQIRAAELLSQMMPRPASPTISIVAPGAQIAPNVASTATPAGGSRRIALLIGNSSYTNAGILKNPRNDVHILADTLRRIGFGEVIEHYDLGLAEMTAALKAFGDKSATADWAVIYFAGHGLEMGGISYLIPVDAKLERDAHITDEAVPLERMLQKAEGARSLRLVILDACRNNPFATRMVRTGGVARSIGRGLAPIEPEGDVLVAYATKHGTTALDGEGNNSPYALALAQHVPVPEVDIRVMFGRVRDTVRKATNNQQEPYTYGSVGGDLHYFVGNAR
jgi:tetratricopeptide (TPR) repeat protein